MLKLAAFVLSFAVASGQWYGNYYCQDGRDVVVNLFEWKWTDIEKECTWLAQNNFCAVQVSPPTEHAIVTDPLYPWWQRYQPVSYEMGSKGGSEADFRSMVNTCNDLGVYIYVDAILNHLTGAGSGFGSAGSWWDGDALSYPGVPYGPDDFHGSDVCFTSDGNIQDFNDTDQVRYCRLYGLVDLKTESPTVRAAMAGFLNKVIGWGVAGFRFDAAKQIFPEELYAIANALDDLNVQWFPAGSRPYIYLEVIDMGGEPITSAQYTFIGRVTEFKHGWNIGDVIRGNFGLKLSDLKNYGEDWSQLPDSAAFVFIDNHDNQRGHGAGGYGSILTFRQDNWYKMANAFQLAWPYGHVRIMSSYNWPENIIDGKDENDWIGPPSDGNGNTNDVDCSSADWICEHRWRQIANMVRFHNSVAGAPVTNWWDNGNNAIAFGRQGKGFIVINNESYDVTQTLVTGLPDGDYCDVISCDNNIPPCGNSGGNCRAAITVVAGSANFNVPTGTDPLIAIHV